MSFNTIGEMIEHRIAASAGDVAIRFKQGDVWQDQTWRQLGDRMERIAVGLMTALADTPLAPRSAISILGNTSPDWIACDFACMIAGLRSVPVYATLLDKEVGYLHSDTEAVIAICEDGVQLEKVRSMRQGFTFFDKDYGPDAVKLRHIVLIDPTGVAPADDWESLADLEARGADQLKAMRPTRQEWLAAVERAHICTYTYTSGTTGPPKGVLQTHGNMLATQESVEQTALFAPEVARTGLFLFLPLAHSFGRLIEHASPYFNSPIIIATIPTLGPDLVDTKPGFFPAAPRVYEKMKAKIEGKVAGASAFRQGMFRWAIGVGKATIPHRSKGRPIPGLLGLKLKLADRLVLSKLRAALGFDNAKVLLSGSAPLGVDVHEFFMAMQLDLLEGYGLTETCPALTCNLPGKIKVGTVGVAVPGVQLQIASDNEILAKGPNVTAGYLNRPNATAEVFDDEGWFYTGDLGSMDSEGFVTITGRKKELMKTSGGKYIAPNKIEGRLKAHTLVQEAVTVADTRNYATALIAIDPEELEVWAGQQGVANDLHSAPVLAEIQRHLDAVNTTLAKYETIKYFRIIPALTVESGLLTASLKVKRKPTYTRYADLIEEMYQPKK